MKIFSEDTVKRFSKTVGERNVVDEIMTLPLFIQTVIGQNVLDPNWTWRRTSWKQIFMALLLIYVYFGTKDYLKTETDPTSIGEAYYTIIITLFYMLKYFVFANTRGSFRKLYLSAKTTLLDMVKADSDDKFKALLKKVKTSMTLLLLTAIVPVSSYLLTALWRYFFGTRTTLSKTTTTLMPMTSPYFEIGLILHLIFLFIMAFTYLVIDTWFVMLMFFFCVAWDSLLNVLKIDQKGSDESDLNYAVRLNDTLRLFYKKHIHLVEYLNILNNTYKWASIVPLLSNLLCVCLIMYLMTENFQWTFLSNILPTCIEVVVFNWFGEQVKIKIVELQMALLHFDWTSMQNKDKKSYLIIVSFMTKDFSLRTAVGNDLSLYTMSSVFKASYQAFAVLKSMET